MSNRGGARPGSGRKVVVRPTPTKVVRLPVDIAELARRMAARGGRSGGVGAFLNIDGTSTAAVPFASASLACGFPSPAEDHLENPLDFNELVGARLLHVFAVRVEGDSMIGVGIHHDDIAVIDRAREAKHNCIVVACLNGDFTLKRYLVRDGLVILHPENPAYPDIVITEDTDFEVFGVLRNIVKAF